MSGRYEDEEYLDEMVCPEEEPESPMDPMMEKFMEDMENQRKQREAQEAAMRAAREKQSRDFSITPAMARGESSGEEDD